MATIIAPTMYNMGTLIHGIFLAVECKWQDYTAAAPICILWYIHVPVWYSLQSPLCDVPSLVHLCSVQEECHVLCPQGRVVRAGDEKSVEIVSILRCLVSLQQCLLCLIETDLLCLLGCPLLSTSPLANRLDETLKESDQLISSCVSTYNVHKWKQ